MIKVFTPLFVLHRRLQAKNSTCKHSQVVGGGWQNWVSVGRTGCQLVGLGASCQDRGSKCAMLSSRVTIISWPALERFTDPPPFKLSRLVRFFLAYVSDDFQTKNKFKGKLFSKNFLTFFPKKLFFHFFFSSYNRLKRMLKKSYQTALFYNTLLEIKMPTR